MKAIQANNLSSIDSYRVVELDMPEPGPAEVRIRIAACARSSVAQSGVAYRPQVFGTSPRTHQAFAVSVNGPS